MPELPPVTSTFLPLTPGMPSVRVLLGAVAITISWSGCDAVTDGRPGVTALGRRNSASAQKTWVAMSLTRATRMEGYDAIRLRSASAHLDATFVPIAGMLGASLREGGAELLGRGLGVHCYARGGTTMGIPLLHPWANRLAADEYRVDGTDVHRRPDSPWSRATSAGCRSTGCWAARLIG